MPPPPIRVSRTLEYLEEMSAKPVQFLRDLLRAQPPVKTKHGMGDIFEQVTELRVESMVLFGKKRQVRRVFVESYDTKDYLGVGWVVKEDMEFCMVCSRPFGILSIFDPQTNCRACGNIVCSRCLDTNTVRQLKVYGPVPVCVCCCWGQAMVCIAPSPPPSFVDPPIPEGRAKYEVVSLWHYGRVQQQEIHPVYVLRSRRSDRSCVFFNVCSCESVPLNRKGVLGMQGRPRLALGGGGSVDAIRSPVEAVFLEDENSEEEEEELVKEEDEEEEEEEQTVEPVQQQPQQEKQEEEQEDSDDSELEGEDSELEDDLDSDAEADPDMLGWGLGRDALSGCTDDDSLLGSEGRGYQSLHLLGELPPLAVRRQTRPVSVERGFPHLDSHSNSDSDSSRSSSSPSSIGSGASGSSEWDAISTEYAPCGSQQSSWQGEQAHGRGGNGRLGQPRREPRLESRQQHAAYVFLEHMIYAQANPQEVQAHMQSVQMQTNLQVFSSLRRPRRNDFHYDVSVGGSLRSGRSAGTSIASFSDSPDSTDSADERGDCESLLSVSTDYSCAYPSAFPSAYLSAHNSPPGFFAGAVSTLGPSASASPLPARSRAGTAASANASAAAPVAASETSRASVRSKASSHTGSVSPATATAAAASASSEEEWQEDEENEEEGAGDEEGQEAERDGKNEEESEDEDSPPSTLTLTSLTTTTITTSTHAATRRSRHEQQEYQHQQHGAAAAPISSAGSTGSLGAETEAAQSAETAQPADSDDDSMGEEPHLLEASTQLGTSTHSISDTHSAASTDVGKGAGSVAGVETHTASGAGSIASGAGSVSVAKGAKGEREVWAAEGAEVGAFVGAVLGAVVGGGIGAGVGGGVAGGVSAGVMVGAGAVLGGIYGEELGEEAGAEIGAEMGAELGADAEAVWEEVSEVLSEVEAEMEVVEAEIEVVETEVEAEVEAAIEEVEVVLSEVDTELESDLEELESDLEEVLEVVEAEVEEVFEEVEVALGLLSAPAPKPSASFGSEEEEEEELWEEEGKGGKFGRKMGEGEEEEEEELWEEEGKGGKFGRKMWEGEEEEEKEDEENDEDKAERERSKKREVERMLMEEEEKEEKEEEEKEEEEEEEKEKEWDKRLLRLTSLRGQLQQDVEEQLEKRGAVGSTGSKKVGFTGPPPTQVDSSDSDEGSDNSGSGSEYEDALPLDTFVLCGQMGTTECKRDVYDVAVHPAVIEACNADKEGQALRQLNQQLLLAVTHVQSELRFPGFEANPITGNYLPRMQVRSAEQKDKDRRHYEQQQEQWTSSLSYWDYLTGTDRGPQPHSSLHKRDRRQPRLSVPAPAAFLHLHCAASSDEDLLNAPPGFDQWAVGSVGSTEFPCYEAALPNLALLRPGQELQARTMVHKLQVQARSRASQPQAPGRDSTSFRLSRNSFGASSFHLPSMQRKRSTLLGGAVYSSDDGNSDDGSETDLASIKILSVKPKHETQYSSLGKKAVYDTRSCRVQGTAAFVIKARSGGKKVFVNVLHNSCFDALAQAGVVCLDQDEEPLTGVGESRSEMGSDGSPCLLFTVLLASSLCRPAKDRRRFERDVQQDWAVHRILETLNEVCGESMGMDYSLPRTRSLYKGRQDPQRPMDFSFKTAQRERPILAPQRSSTGAQLREAQVQSKGKGGLATIDEAEEGEGVLDAGAEGQEDEEVDSGTKRGEGGERAAMERSLTLRELEEEEEEEASAGSSGPPVQSVARPTLTKTKSRQQAQLRIGGRGDTRQGASMVTIDMVLYCLELSLGQEEVQRLKFEAIKSPNALLGWQCVVVLEAGAEAGLYVITKVSKASVRQQLMGKHTLFRISHPDRGDQWVQLKRKPSQKKQALYFHPTRKVLFLEHKQK